MSVFDFFGSSDKSADFEWNKLRDVSQLDSISQDSFEKPQLIFKHSTRCVISRFSLKQFEKNFKSAEEITPYFLDLLQHRDVSNEIANRFEVIHQSPQLLLIKEGKCIFEASHDAIDASILASVL